MERPIHPRHFAGSAELLLFFDCHLSRGVRMPHRAQHHGELLPRLSAKVLADVFRHLLAKPCDASPGVRRRVTVEPQVSEPVEPQLSLRPFPAALIITKCRRSEEHTSELQSLMRINYAVFCL